MQLQNPYDFSPSRTELLYLNKGQRDYVKQMTFILESYEGREPETSNLSRHIYHIIHGYPEPIQYIKKTISLPIAEKNKVEP
jgi:hypothetical protein